MAKKENTTATIKNTQTTQELLASSAPVQTRQILTSTGLKKVYEKIKALILTKENKEENVVKIKKYASIISNSLHVNTCNGFKDKEELFLILSEIDNIYLNLTEEFNNLLRSAILIVLYANNKSYEDYEKNHNLLNCSNNRKLFVNMQTQLLNSNYFIISYGTQSVSNFINGSTVSEFNINNVILRPLPPQNATREILESQGITFFEKPKHVESECIDLQERREEAYSILAAEGLADLFE